MYIKGMLDSYLICLVNKFRGPLCMRVSGFHILAASCYGEEPGSDVLNKLLTAGFFLFVCLFLQEAYPGSGVGCTVSLPSLILRLNIKL